MMFDISVLGELTFFHIFTYIIHIYQATLANPLINSCFSKAAVILSCKRLVALHRTRGCYS